MTDLIELPQATESKRLFEKYKLRCHSLHLLMGNPKNKSDILSATAKTNLIDMAKQYVYGYEVSIDAKYLKKGLACEQKAIDLYNSVMFTNHQKNDVRFSNNWLSGEPDILTDTEVIDIKNAWSLDTFPSLSEQVAKKDEYEWQLRAYMMLTERPVAKIAYCLVNTPPELIGWENPVLHDVEHLDESLRLTIATFHRDLGLEEKIKQKVEAARIFMDETVRQIAIDHTF